MNMALTFLFLEPFFFNRLEGNITLGEFFITAVLAAILVEIQDIYRRNKTKRA